MENRYFLFKEGQMEERTDIEEIAGEKLFLSKVPTNFLELVDELKKFSFVSHAVYVTFSDENMSICIFKRDSLETFKKHHDYLMKEETYLPVHERLKDFLFSLREI